MIDKTPSRQRTLYSITPFPVGEREEKRRAKNGGKDGRGERKDEVKND